MLAQKVIEYIKVIKCGGVVYQHLTEGIFTCKSAATYNIQVMAQNKEA